MLFELKLESSSGPYTRQNSNAVLTQEILFRFSHLFRDVHEFSSCFLKVVSVCISPFPKAEYVSNSIARFEAAILAVSRNDQKREHEKLNSGTSRNWGEE